MNHPVSTTVVSKPQIAFLTGSTGFIGRFLILQLLKQQHQVFALLRQPLQQAEPLRQWLQQKGANINALQFIQGDLGQPDLGITSNDWQKLQEVNVIYNTGALFGWGLNATQARQINVAGALNFLKLAAQHCKLERAVQVSGYMLTIKPHLQQAGIDINCLDNTDWPQVYKRLGAYEASKFEAHFAWIQQAKNIGVAWTIIHPATVIGDETTGEIADNQAISQMLKDLKTGKLAAIPGSGRHRLPLIGVNDLTKIMVLAATDAQTVNRELLVANAQTPNLKSVLSIAAQQMQINVPKYYVSIKFLKILVKWQWLARQLNLSGEMLDFLRTENLDTNLFDQLRIDWKLPQPDLTQNIQATANWINNKN